MITATFENINDRCAVVLDSGENIGTLEYENGLWWFVRNPQFSSDDPVVYGFVRAFCGEAGRLDISKLGNSGCKYEPQEAW
jgi:hypothetical protein